MKKVLLSKPINPAGMKVLEGKVEPVILSYFNIETIKKMVADVEGIILRTNIKITGDIIDAAPNLKVISRTGAGVDNVDVTAATKKGILVCHAPSVNSISVAEHALALMMAMAKQLKTIDKAVHNGNWKIRYASKAEDLDGKTLGLVGIGNIGYLVAQKCRLAFNMKVIAYDPYVKEVEDVELCSNLDQLFSQSDFISIHVPYTKETHYLVNARLLSLMKPGSYLINTSRGAVIDEKALIEVLKKGSIAGAGLDVFEKEPPSLDNPLLRFENVITTSHSAGLNRDCERKLAIEAAQAVVDFLEGRQPKHIYNKEELLLK
ncbi:hydroxyacid dehydrogenase [Candidatus Atribacteria bacterium MT.SAG.1]|nr:hydroxyacid dehydrogenase [Candidatus Atribacteria bacterium MT.SAG.1]